MHIKIKKTFRFIYKLRKEKIDMKDFDKQVLEHVQKVIPNLHRNGFGTDFRYNNDYFITMVIKKTLSNKIKVIVNGFVKDWGVVDDIRIYLD